MFFLVGAILMSTKVVRQLWFQHELHSLRNADIIEIQIDAQALTSNAAREELVSALNASMLLDPRDGGPVRRSVDIRVRLRSGSSHSYSVARYHDGASIISGSREAFSPALVSLLERAGKPLPDWRQ